MCNLTQVSNNLCLDPHFVGFFGIYCRKDSHSLYPITDSSMYIALPGWYTFWNTETNASMNRADFEQLVMPLLTTWDICVIVHKVKTSNRSQLMMDDMLLQWNAHCLLQYCDIFGRMTTRMIMTIYKNRSRSALVNGHWRKLCGLARDWLER